MEDKDLLQHAISLANECHWHQCRKYSGKPFVLHPLRVMLEANKLYDDVPAYVLAAAVCHDVLEDCEEITFAKLEIGIGTKAAKIVQELTNPSKGSKERRAVRKQMDRDHLSTIHKRLPQEDAIWAWHLKLLDRIDNLADMRGCDDSGFVKLYLEESNLLLKAIVDGSCDCGCKKEIRSVADRLGSTIFSLYEGNRKTRSEEHRKSDDERR